jgi:enoyl-CoA hydratase/3-hydroxyacyl-CoA dehydrogenase
MSDTRTLAVIGAGNMGSGIAQKMATEGFRVLLVDLNEAQLDRGLAGIKKTLEEGVARKIFRPEQAEQILGRVVKTTDWSHLAAAELVVEAVFEDLEVKKDVFRRLGAATKPDCVLGSNTSSFYVRDLAAVTPHPERVVGLHYFYHPAKNRLVEVIPTAQTSKAALAKANAVQAAISKTAITCADAPGFVVNRYFVPWLNEAVRLLDEGVANIATIEAASKEAFGVGMGPFELMNVTGVPIALHAAGTLGRELGAFYAPSPRLKAQVEAKQNWPLEGTVEDAKKAAVADRLLGVAFLVAGSLVDERVGTIEDTDIGARVGLRWPKGPFELMNRVGVEKAAALANAVGKPYGLSAPKILAGRTAPFTFKLVETTVEDRVATLTINRPDALNALNEEVMKQLDAAFDAAAARADVDGIVIAGSGKAFIAGADIRYFVKRIESKKIDEIVAFTRKGHETLLKFGKARQPVIALVDGLSLGGGSELALACDYIVATKKGSFGFPETGIGIYPGLGGTQRLSRRVGVPLAKAYVYTGNGIDAATGAKIGLVDRLVGHEEIAAAVKDLVKRGKAPERKADARVPAGFEKVAAPFQKNPVAAILAGAAGSDADEQKQLDRVRQKAPVALKIAEGLIDASATLPIKDGAEAELGKLTEIFSTADAYLGLSTLGKSKPTFAGK